MTLQLEQNSQRTLFRSVVSAASCIIFLTLTGCQASRPANTVRFALATEPPNLNSMKATDTQSSFVLGHVMEGLTRKSKSGESIPGVAEKWTITDQTATFNLRKNALWSDGKPVTAKDFVFAWKTAVDPKTASEYAFILYPIKNAELINKGKAAPETLGAKAVDDFTLEISFEKPCGYFLGLTSFTTYFPIREDFFQTRKDKYAAEASDLLFNGAFKLTKWVHGAELVLEKNENYWNKEIVKLAKIDIPYVTSDNTARFNFYKDKKTDLLESLSKDDLSRAQAERFKLKSHADGSLSYLEFNFRDDHATKNKNLRQAIQLIFNTEEYVAKVIGVPGTKPGTTLVPGWMRGVQDLFRKEYPYQAPALNIAEAKKKLELAKKELGGSIPALVLLTGDSPTATREAEYFQNQFKTHLGIDLKIDKQIFKQRLAKMSSGEFDIVSAGWSPDFADPMTFADLMASWNENNRGKWKNDAYDAFIRKAQATSAPKLRMDAMAAAEKIVLDEVALLPLAERALIWTHAEGLEGVVRNSVGFDPDFTTATYP